VYSILIVGYGYVGSAVASIFKRDTVNIIDPKYNDNKIKDFENKTFDAVFVCVDTPKNEKFRVLNTVLKQLNDCLAKGTPVCCKSTASPIFYEKAYKEYKNISLLHSPEYLSHWNNIADFQNQEFIIIGGDKAPASKVSSILCSRLFKVKELRITDIKTAALIKYSENAFLSLKVTFANEIYKAHKLLKCKSQFKDFTEMLGLDARIGGSHLQVPGRDGKFGWGGHCFTKDNNEFIKFTKSKLIDFIIKINRLHRKSK